MWKPWVVVSLSSALVASFVLLLIAAVWCAARPSRAVNYACLILLALNTAAAFALGAQDTTGYLVLLGMVMYGVGCAFRYRWWMGSLTLLTALAFPVGPLMLVVALHTTTDELFVLIESRIAPDLVCRAYPKHFDSVQGTRVLLIRQRRLALRDEIVRELLQIPYAASSMECTQQKDGSVRVRLWNSSGRELPP